MSVQAKPSDTIGKLYESGGSGFAQPSVAHRDGLLMENLSCN